jgi:hypothetical protein
MLAEVYNWLFMSVLVLTQFLTFFPLPINPECLPEMTLPFLSLLMIVLAGLKYLGYLMIAGAFLVCCLPCIIDMINSH